MMKKKQPKQEDHFFTSLPATKNYFHRWLVPVLTALEQGQSVRLVHLPYSGGTGLLRYFLQMPETIFADWNKRGQDYLFIWRDLAAEDDQYESFGEKKSWGSKELREKLKEWTWKGKKKVVITISQAEDLLKDSKQVKELYSLLRVNPMFVQFIFRVGAEIDEVRAEKKLDYLYLNFSQNLVYLPLYGQADLKNILENQRYWYQIKIGIKEEKLIAKVWGGWAPLVRVLTRRLNNSSEKQKTLDWLKDWDQRQVMEEILADDELKFYFGSLWDCLLVPTQQFFVDLINKKIKKAYVLQKIPPYLTKTNCLVGDDRSLRGVKFFSPWFEAFLQTKIKALYPSLQEKEGRLWLEGKPLDELLTPQELKVFRLLWDNQGRVVNRDQIAQVIWDEEWTEKYSDWALDKLLARIRKKIGDTGRRRLVRVVKGQGVMFKKPSF